MTTNDGREYITKPSTVKNYFPFFRILCLKYWTLDIYYQNAKAPMPVNSTFSNYST